MTEKTNWLKERLVGMKRLQSWKYWSGFEDQMERSKIKEIEAELEELGETLTQEEYNIIVNYQQARRMNFQPIEMDIPILELYSK